MPQQDMPVERFSRFIESVEGLECLELQGEGEPLLHTGFFNMVGIARDRFPELEVSVITNGSMFSTDNVRRILDFDIRRVYVSVESVQDDVFQRIRGGKLDKLRKGIVHLLEQRSARNMRYPVVGLAVTILKSTIPELARSIPAFYREMGMDGGVTFQSLQAMPQYTRFYNVTSTEEMIVGRESRQLMQQIQSSKDLRELLDERDFSLGFYEHLYGSVDRRFYCPWLTHGLYLAAGGEVVPCCHVKDYQEYAMANIEDGLYGVAKSRSMMQKTLHNGQIPAACADCGQAKQIVHNIMHAGMRTLHKPE